MLNPEDLVMSNKQVLVNKNDWNLLKYFSTFPHTQAKQSSYIYKIASEFEDRIRETLGEFPPSRCDEFPNRIINVAKLESSVPDSYG